MSDTISSCHQNQKNSKVKRNIGDEERVQQLRHLWTATPSSIPSNAWCPEQSPLGPEHRVGKKKKKGHTSYRQIKDRKNLTVPILSLTI